MRIKLPAALIQFLLNQDNIQIQSGANKLLSQEDSFIKQLFAQKKHTVDLREPYYNRGYVKWFYGMIMHPWFDATIIGAIILNTISLALDRDEPYPRWM